MKRIVKFHVAVSFSFELSDIFWTWAVCYTLGSWPGQCAHCAHLIIWPWLYVHFLTVWWDFLEQLKIIQMVSKFSFRGAQLFITDFTKVHYIPIPRIISIHSTHLRPIFEIHNNIRVSSRLPFVVLIIDVSSSHIRNRIFYQAVCMLRSFFLIEFHENKVYLLSIRGPLGICFRLL
jgi:hypothetical protein